MASFIPKFEVQNGRTVTCKMGVAHPGAILTPANFSGEDNEEKAKKIIAIVETGAMKPVPLTDAEKEAIAEQLRKAEAAEKKEAERLAALELEKQEEAERLETERLAALELAETRKTEIIEADFDSMNKDPMIEFAKEHDITLTGTKADEIREELKALQESLTAPE